MNMHRIYYQKKHTDASGSGELDYNYRTAWPSIIGENLKFFESTVRNMTTDHNEKMKARTAILFPHSYLPEFARDRILSYFGSQTHEKKEGNHYNGHFVLFYVALAAIPQ